MQDEHDEHWSAGSVVGMLRAAADTVAAHLIATQALTPAEVRAASFLVGTSHIDDLRRLSVETVAAARDLTDDAYTQLLTWDREYRRDRAAATRAYLKEGRTPHGRHRQ